MSRLSQPAALLRQARALVRVFFGHAPFGSNGFSPASAYTYTRGRSSAYNYNLNSSSFPGIESRGGFVNFSHKVFGDQMVIFGDLFYENTKIAR